MSQGSLGISKGCRTMALFFAFLLWVVVAPASWAASLQHNGKFWASAKLSGEVNPSSNVRYLLQFHTRWRTENPILQKTFVRAGLGYALNNRVTLWLGYDYGASPQLDSSGITQSQRVWQQLSVMLKQTATWSLTSRTRFEQRDNFDAPGVALRLRQRISIFFPVVMSGKVTPMLSDELFFNLNHPVWVTSNVIDQNRLFLGVRAPLNDDVKLEFGYLNQFSLRNPTNRMDHILLVSFLFRHNVG